MKQVMEKIIPLKGLKNADAISREIERAAEQAHQQGWFFVSSATDEWVESVTLFFERELEV